MRTSIKYTLIGFTSGVLLSAGVAGFAFGPMPHGFGYFAGEDAEGRAAFREFVTERIGKKLNLDDAQQQALKQLAEKLGATKATMIEDRQQTFAKVQGVIQGASFDKAAALALVDEKTGKIREQAPDVVASLAGFYDGLNPTQQQQVRDWVANRGEHWAERHHR